MIAKHAFLLVCFTLLSMSAATQPYKICSVPYCTSVGASATCFVSVQHGLHLPTTCQQWADTDEGRKQCTIKCVGSCFFIPIYDNDGSWYCRLCDLYIQSCRTKFRVTGPAPPPYLEATSRASDVFTTVRQEGWPLFDCSMNMCTVFGAEWPCLFKQVGQPDQEMTCADYASTSQSQAQCQFTCPQCTDPDGPYDNERTQYCSMCDLRMASCDRDYEIYGPYLVRGLEECSEEYCSTNGDEARCVPTRFHTIIVTCAEWQASQ